MLIWLILACGDPDYGSLGDSLTAYDRGRTAMESGDYQSAVSAFEKAMKADPQRPALIAWYANALQRAGDSGGALQHYDEGLKRFPDDIDLRYNRAALRATTGDLKGSGEDLRWLYANDAVHPVQVGEDSDFIALGTESDLSGLIPAAQVEASVKGESGSVLLGETYAVEFTVTARSGADIGMTLVGDSIPQLALHRLVEDVTDVGEIWTQRVLRAEFLGVEAGRVAAGPWLISASGTTSLTGRVDVEVVQLPGQGAVSSPTGVELAMPSVIWSELAHPGIVQMGGASWAWIPQGSYIQPATATDGIKMEYRESGQPKWSAVRLRAGVEVKLRDGSRVVKASH
jgi:hypothetical protein